MNRKQLLTFLLLLVAGVGNAVTVQVSLNPSTNGTFSGESTAVSGYYTTWTSNAASGCAGLALTTGGNLAMCEQNVSSYGGNLLALKTTSSSTAENLIITAPAGYFITGYTMTVRLYSSTTDQYRVYMSTGGSNYYTITSSTSGKDIAESGLNTTSLTLQVADLKTPSTYYLCVTSLSVELETAATLGTALTSLDALDTGWYRVKCTTGTYADRFLYNLATEITYNTSYNYPIGVQAAAGNVAEYDATYFIRFEKNGTARYMRMPNGHYINREKPTALTGYSTLTLAYDAGFYFHYSYYFTPMSLNGVLALGESSSASATRYGIYPVDLDDLSLTAWQLTINGGVLGSTLPVNDSQVTCVNANVKGLSSVYSGGYFFLPSDVTPTASDFKAQGLASVTVNTTDKTITATIDPNIAIGSENVTVAQGWQTAGRDGEVMLLRVNAAPFKDATNATLNVRLLDGAESNISALTLYEASSDSPEILSAGNSGAPTKTQIATTSVSGSTATFSIGNLTAGNHYYWLGATVKSDATLGAVLDAAVTGITYTCNSTKTTLDLTSVGDPADRGAMVFNVRSYPFLPWENGSHVYRIPAMVVANDGSIIAAVDKRYANHTDIGVPAGHVIDIVVRRSTDGGKTWGAPVVIAKGQGTTNSDYAGFGDPSLIRGNDGTIYCFFAAGNLGYGKGLNKICMSKSTDNGVTWDSSESTLPTELVTSGKVTNHASSYGSNTCYGLYDYFVTSGRGLCTSEGYLMGLLPAQAYTDADKTAYTSNAQDYIFYSTDGGENWHISENAIFVGGDEAKVIQANDGSLIASVRQSSNRGFNTATYTYNDSDGTLTFTMGTQYNNSQIQTGAANNQDILYYSRANAIGSGTVGTSTGEPDILLHSMTTGNHANLNLYMSIDGGQNWTQVFQVQSKGARYVTMDKLANGDLALLFEDQSLNATGGSTDYNHYPINFLTITKEQILAMAEPLVEAAEDADVEHGTVKVVYGSTSYYSTSGNVMTTNAASGMAGLTVTKSDGSFNQFSDWNSHYNLAYVPATANTASTLTLAAPDGYKIAGYSLLAAKAYSADHTYTLTAADGTTSITPAFASSASGYTELSVTGVNAATTTISITTTSVSYYLAIADFTVDIVKDGVTETAVKVTNNDATSYGTLTSNIWTSGESSGLAGLRLSSSDITLTTPTAHSNTVLGLKVNAGSGTSGTLTLSAPAGYLIAGYDIEAHNWSSGNSFTLTPVEGTGSAVTVTNYASGSTTALTVSDINSNIAHLTVTATTQTNPLCLRKLVVTLYNTLKASKTITYAVVDAEGNVVSQVENQGTYIGYVPVLPTSSIDKRAFCTYNEEFYKDAALTTPLTTVHSTTETVYSTFTFDGPFEFSTVENPKWYLMYSREQGENTTDYCAYANGTAFATAAVDISSVDNTKALYDDAEYQWAFIGNPYAVKLLNKKQNGYLSAAAKTVASNGTAVTSAIVSDNDGSNPYNAFSVYGFTNSNITNTTTPFALALNGSDKKTWVDGKTPRLLYHGNITVNDALQINNWRTANWEAVEVPTTYDVTLNAVGDASYATLYLPFDVTMPAGTKPYAVNISGSSAVMSEIEGGLPAGTPAVVVNESGATSVKLDVTTGLTAYDGTNALVGTYTDMALDLAADNGNYSLGRQKDVNEDYVIGFYKFQNGDNTTITLKANRAYLSTGDTPVGIGDVKGFRLVWGGEDAIESIGTGTTTTGQRIYNIAGQRVSVPSRGLYIVNGQKVIVK